MQTHSNIFITVSGAKSNEVLDDDATLIEIIDTIKDETFNEEIELIANTPFDKQQMVKFCELPRFYPCINLEKVVKFEKNDKPQTTGLIQFDVDDITQAEANTYKQQLIDRVPELLYAFISPRGGLKFALITDLSCDVKSEIKGKFKIAYEIAAKYIQSTIKGIKLDDGVSSIVKACFFSVDKNIYFNDKAAVFELNKSVNDQYNTEQNRISAFVQTNHSEDQSIELIEEKLSFIPTDLNYQDRLQINFAVIDALGANALNILLNHWTVDNRYKLENDIRNQIRDFDKSSNSITGATLTHMAKKYGYSPEGQNTPSVETDLPPTFNGTILSVNEAEIRINQEIDSFFTDKESKLTNADAGIGKTKAYIDNVVDLVIKNQRSKFAIFVTNHKLANEITSRLVNAYQKKRPKPINWFKNITESNLKLNHIQGRHKLCKSQLIDKDIFKNKAHLLCEKCFYYQVEPEFCPYLSQFKSDIKGFNVASNVRVYTHDALFNTEGRFDKNWKPNYLIIDEDIIANKLLSQPEKIKYGTDDLIDKIITDFNKLPMFELVEKYRQEIISKINAQDAAIERSENILLSNIQSGRYEYKSTPYQKYNLLEALLAVEEGCFNPGIYLDDNKQLSFVKKNKMNLKYTGIPKLFLDATSIESVVENAFDEPVKFVSIKAELQPNVKVYQVENNNFSKTKLDKNQSSIQEKVTQFIKAKTKEGEKVGLISYMDHVENFGDITEHNYFGNLRGLDAFSDFDKLFVVGRKQLPEYALKEKYRALISGNHPESEGLFKHEILNFEKSYSDKVVRMKSGKNRLIKNEPTYNNELLSALDVFINGGETLQAIHRLRLIHGNKHKEVYFLSNKVLDLTVDELLNTDKIFGRNNNKVKNKNIPQIIDLIKQNKIVPFKKAEFKSRTDLSLRQVNTIFNKDNIESLNNEMALADINFVEVSGYDFSNNKSTKHYFTDGVISDKNEFKEFKSVNSIEQEQLSAA